MISVVQGKQDWDAISANINFTRAFYAHFLNVTIFYPIVCIHLIHVFNKTLQERHTNCMFFFLYYYYYLPIIQMEL